MITSWDSSIEFVLEQEGGYVNDPNDPGGETNFGISKRSYPQLDIKDLTREQASAIYFKDYWTRCACNSLASGLDLVVLDSAVNMGVGVALNLLNQYGDPDRFTLHRILRYTTYAKFNLYGTSWVHRSLAAYKLALTLAGAPSSSQGIATAPKGT